MSGVLGRFFGRTKEKPRLPAAARPRSRLSTSSAGESKTPRFAVSSRLLPKMEPRKKRPLGLAFGDGLLSDSGVAGRSRTAPAPSGVRGRASEWPMDLAISPLGAS